MSIFDSFVNELEKLAYSGGNFSAASLPGSKNVAKKPQEVKTKEELVEEANERIKARGDDPEVVHELPVSEEPDERIPPPRWTPNVKPKKEPGVKVKKVDDNTATT